MCPGRRLALLALLLTAALPPTLSAQARPDPATLIAAQKEAMASLAFMDGVWRGPAWTILPSGEKHNITQTERIGPFLDGSVKVIEGRGYDPDGKATFNAFGTISYDPGKKAYTLHSHAMGYVGDFALTPTADGYTWEIPTGPVTIRYTAVIKDGAWKETGDRIAPGKDPVRFFEMNLKRVGDSTWPAAGAIPPK
ncbi:MAG: DUF1579 domain-containing protein [Acidobacteriota bacterium]|nr:DUF1579 domain-containing protein [Acidobacteriota bacterium]